VTATSSPFTDGWLGGQSDGTFGDQFGFLGNAGWLLLFAFCISSLSPWRLNF
jgi:hypothetical protein